MPNGLLRLGNENAVAHTVLLGLLNDRKRLVTSNNSFGLVQFWQPLAQIGAHHSLSRFLIKKKCLATIEGTHLLPLTIKFMVGIKQVRPGRTL